MTWSMSVKSDQQQKDMDKLVSKAVAYAEKFCYSKAILFDS